MATVRATCNDCGDVKLTEADLHVRICDDDNTSTYSFRCPACAMIVVKTVSSQTCDLLVAAGAPFTTWTLPAELHEPKTGDLISHDDLLEFHELLNNESAFEQAVGQLLSR